MELIQQAWEWLLWVLQEERAGVIGTWIVAISTVGLVVATGTLVYVTKGMREEIKLTREEERWWRHRDGYITRNRTISGVVRRARKNAACGGRDIYRERGSNHRHKLVRGSIQGPELGDIRRRLRRSKREWIGVRSRRRGSERRKWAAQGTIDERTTMECETEGTRNGARGRTETERIQIGSGDNRARWVHCARSRDGQNRGWRMEERTDGRRQLHSMSRGLGILWNRTHRGRRESRSATNCTAGRSHRQTDRWGMAVGRKGGEQRTSTRESTTGAEESREDNQPSRTESGRGGQEETGRNVDTARRVTN